LSTRWACRSSFLCETSEVEPGRIFKPRGESLGSGLGAFNVRGAQLVATDFSEHLVEAERLDGGGLSAVTVRVCGLLSYVVLKILAFQDRHDNKDSYDLVFCVLHHGDGPRAAGRAAARSPVAAHPQVADALRLLGERFVDIGHDGPVSYAAFLPMPTTPVRAPGSGVRPSPASGRSWRASTRSGLRDPRPRLRGATAELEADDAAGDRGNGGGIISYSHDRVTTWKTADMVP
jgi:hypothetical protein